MSEILFTAEVKCKKNQDEMRHFQIKKTSCSAQDQIHMTQQVKPLDN